VSQRKRKKVRAPASDALPRKMAPEFPVSKEQLRKMEATIDGLEKRAKALAKDKPVGYVLLNSHRMDLISPKVFVDINELVEKAPAITQGNLGWVCICEVRMLLKPNLNLLTWDLIERGER
jgi:hypothetical protein